jgi:hypothetical protein
MALSRFASHFAAEINNHDWSDSPWRTDRAGHKRTMDRIPSRALEPDEAENVKINAMWVTAQVLAYADPNFSVDEFAVACGLPKDFTHRSNGNYSKAIINGLRMSGGRVAIPGTYVFDQ